MQKQFVVNTKLCEKFKSKYIDFQALQKKYMENSAGHLLHAFKVHSIFESRDYVFTKLFTCNSGNI